MKEHCFCFYFVYCHLSLGVKAVVKAKSFLQRHQLQLPSAPSGYYWCIVGTAWQGQWLARTMKLGATQRTRPLHDGKEQWRKQMLPQRTHRRGVTVRDTETSAVSVSRKFWFISWRYRCTCFKHNNTNGKKSGEILLHQDREWYISFQPDNFNQISLKSEHLVALYLYITHIFSSFLIKELDKVGKCKH